MSVQLVLAGSGPTRPVAAGAIGILGGAFDPVHSAHVVMARNALDSLKLSKVLWIPSGIPPHREPPIAAAEHRAAMVRLAIREEPRFVLDERELRKTTPGYTVETLEELRAEYGSQVELVLLIGADQFQRLQTWHRWRDLESLARLGLHARPPYPLTVSGQALVVPMPLMEVSSTAIRERIAAGEPVRGMVPEAALDYIQSHNLYCPQERRTR